MSLLELLLLHPVSWYLCFHFHCLKIIFFNFLSDFFVDTLVV